MKLQDWGLMRKLKCGEGKKKLWKREIIEDENILYPLTVKMMLLRYLYKQYKSEWDTIT